MSDLNENAPASGGKTPDCLAYQVRNRIGKSSIFTRIGAAWYHKDGKGLNVELNAVPLDGVVVIRIATEKKE